MADRDVYSVMAGEAMYGPGRYDDMRNIASVVVNRSRSLGVSPGNVVRTQQEFNAYGKALPKGAAAYIDMAKRAWDDVATNGPVHAGTFYATPSATKNLPKGLRQVGQTAGHVYYDDPQNRAIGTALGYRQPTALTAAQRAIAEQTRQPAAQPRNVPTPTFATRNVPTPIAAPRAAPTLSASLARAPVSGPAVASAASLPAGLTAPAIRGGRIGPNTTTGVPTPTSRPSQVAASLPDASRFGGFAPTANVASLRTRAVPTPTANPLSISSFLGISPAAAATPTPRPSPMTARVPAGALSPSITPGAVTSFAPRMAMAPTNRFAARPPVASSVPTPTSTPRPAQSLQRVATPTARPQAARPQATPATTRAAPVRDAWGGLREVATSQPQAVSRTAAAAPATSGPFGLSRGMVGRVAGAALGSMVGGPVGGLLGGVLGGRIANGTGGNGAGRGSQSAGSTNGASRSSSGRSSGFGGFGERDSAVGLDGGRVSGASRSAGKASAGKSSSSSSAGKSSGSSKSGGSGGKSGGGKGGKK